MSERIVAPLLAGLTTKPALDVFQIHGRIPELFEYVIYYSNSWGNAELQLAETPKAPRGKKRRTAKSIYLDIPSTIYELL